MALVRGLLTSKLLWGVLLVAMFWSLGRIALRSLARDPRFDARPVSLRAQGPEWGGPEVVRPVLDRLQTLGTVNLFDPRFDDRIRSALLEVPGVASVPSVRRIWPREYAVSVSLRRPVAIVVDGSGTSHPVTAQGVVLPPGPYARACRGLMGIRGLESAAPRPGETWVDRRLADGLETVVQLRPHLERLNPLQLAWIDVSRAEDSREGVRLLGLDGVVVRWGRPRATVGENPVERKIRFLEIAASDALAIRGRETDVRYSRLYWRPLSKETLPDP